jgi:CheY-like chemotaxis protein
MQPILVVDDELEVRELLIEALIYDGYPVVAVEHGQAALDYLQSDAPLPS